MTPAAAAMAVPAAESFDYSIIPAHAAEQLRRSAASIRSLITRTTADIIETGRELTAVKQRLEHGQFEKWTESEVKIAHRTAQAYMVAARLAEAKGATIALLPPTTVHRLSSKSAPADVVETVISHAKAGEVIPDRAVQEMLAEAKFQAKQKAAADKREARDRKRSKRERERRDRERQEWQVQKQQEEKEARQAALILKEKLGPELSRLVVSTLIRHCLGFDIQAEFARLLDEEAQP
jgi:hypothetical protein